MKKTNTNRLAVLVLAILMVLSMFVGCTNQQGREDLKNAIQGESVSSTNDGEKTQESDKDSSSQIAEIQAQVDALNQSLEKANVSLKTFEEKITLLEKENETLKANAEESAKAFETVNVEKAKLQSEIATLEAEKAALEAEKAALLEQIAKLEANADSKVDRIGDKIFADLDYVLGKITFIFDDGTAALKATTEGIPVYVTSREVIGSQTAYLKNTVMLPREGYNYAVTYDCVNVYTVATGGNNQSYSYANGGLFLGEKLTTGYQLKETTLRGAFGLTDDLLEAVIVAVEDPSAEYGYSFYVRVGNYASNPVYEPACKHGDGCHCGDCDKCPALEPEVIVKTEVKTEVVEVEKVVEVPGETVYIPGETIYIPGEVIHIHWYWCSNCNNLKENCTCKTQTPENNTQRPDDTVFAPDAPADQPSATVPENNKASGESEFVTSNPPADQPDSSNESSNANQTVDNGPADQPQASGNASQPESSGAPADQNPENSHRDDDCVFA